MNNWKSFYAKLLNKKIGTLMKSILMTYIITIKISTIYKLKFTENKRKKKQ